MNLLKMFEKRNFRSHLVRKTWPIKWGDRESENECQKEKQNKREKKRHPVKGREKKNTVGPT